MKKSFQMDNNAFNPTLMKMVLEEASPKLHMLFKKIADLDAKDMKKHGKLFKHFIFCDVADQAYGAKLVASAFAAMGFTCAFTPTLTLLSDSKLLETKSNNFGLLASKPIYDKTMPTKFRKEIKDKYNERPNNIQGELMRFIILDFSHKEGIDLFDVKYVHLLEPLVTRADEKQSIGRATRFCGQKSLDFHPNFGWSLYVFRYDIKFDDDKKIENANTMFELFLNYSNIDLNKVIFASELENVVIDASIDRDLNKTIHTFKIDSPPPILDDTPHGSPIRGGSLKSVHNDITKNYTKYAYPEVKLENKCNEALTEINFTPTQELIRNYFRPELEQKGMLLWHSVGTGKTCTAIATATTGFEKENYTILWVTRHTLKSDIWKNMFRQICHMKFIQDKKKFPAKISGPMKFLSNQWVQPLSYKQFSNMLLKKNRFYEEIVKKNGELDPLRKTLLIIDEAHKLYTTTGPVAERPKIDIFEDMIQKSYKVSGKDSVRVLLMTATPYTEDSMEMIKLLNLLREVQMPSHFHSFSTKYLDNNGYFTNTGKKEFQDDIAGYVSYVNRMQDARNFAHPIIEPVYVKMSYKEDRKPTKELDVKIKALVQDSKAARVTMKEEKANCADALKDIKADCREENKEMVANIKAEYKTKKQECKKDNACIQQVNIKYDRLLDKAKYNKKEDINNCIDKNKSKACPDLGEAENALQTILSNKKELQSKIKVVAVENKEIMSKMKTLKLSFKDLRIEKKQLITDKKTMNKIDKKAANIKLRTIIKNMNELKAEILQLNEERLLKKISIFRAVLPDASMATMVNRKCLKDKD
jgi:hypothetical protein